MIFKSEKVLLRQPLSGVAGDGALSIEVIEKSGRVEMRFGNHVVQSAKNPDSDALLLAYTQAFLVGLVLMANPQRLLHIGLGGGCVPQLLANRLPGLMQHVVEIHPEVLHAAQTHFGFTPGPALTVGIQDAALYLKAHPHQYDLIFLDAYGPDGVPDHLKTRSFLEEVARHLAPGGWLVTNAWGYDRNLLRLEVGRQAQVFGQMHRITLSDATNVVLFATDAGTDFPDRLVRNRRAFKLAQHLNVPLVYLADTLAPISRGKI